MNLLPCIHDKFTIIVDVQNKLLLQVLLLQYVVPQTLGIS